MLRSRVELDLYPAGLSLVEGLVGLEGARDNEPDELGDVLAVVAVTAPDGQVALLDHAYGGGHGLWREDPDDPDHPSLFDALRRPDEGLGGRIARNPGLPLRVRLGGDPVQFLRVLPTGDLSHGPGLRALGVDADGLYDTVYPDAAG